MADFISTLVGIFNIFYTWFIEIILYFVPNRLRMKDVSRDIVLITGGGSGFGRLLAIKFAKLGSTVILWDVNEQGLQESKNEIKRLGKICYTYVCDISKRKEVYATAEAVKKEIGHVTILVNNAGIAYSASFLRLNDENIEKTINVNLLSHFWTCKAFLPSMLNAKRGHIVSVASVASFAGIPKLADYSASKAAAVSLMESLYLETRFSGHTNIEFTAICPYFMDTGLFAGSGSTFMPNLSPEVAAEEAMKGILTNQSCVMIPKSLIIPFSLKPIMPVKASVELAKLLGAETALDGFVGRHGKSSLNNNENVK